MKFHCNASQFHDISDACLLSWDDIHRSSFLGKVYERKEFGLAFWDGKIAYLIVYLHVFLLLYSRTEEGEDFRTAIIHRRCGKGMVLIGTVVEIIGPAVLLQLTYNIRTAPEALAEHGGSLVRHIPVGIAMEEHHRTRLGIPFRIAFHRKDGSSKTNDTSIVELRRKDVCTISITDSILCHQAGDGSST